MANRCYTAAGITYRACGDCGGAGDHVLTHWSRDPQLEERLTCCTCGGRGYVRASAFDPLEVLQTERRAALRMSRRPGDELAALLAPTALASYRRARARAMAPAPLPNDIAPATALEHAA
ncbi:hypothetical protein [Lysobacter sp. Hz 25]|uniref:hypothetical protein n=1 Tax=Lysobacter sp. Hz 25 TaxID=3383698 RepID=UPI0038D4ACF3